MCACLHPGPATARPAELSEAEFRGVRDFLFARAGISLTPPKKALVNGRLARRIGELGLTGVAGYLAYITTPEHADEAQHAVDLLTTNETHFFREPQHLDFLRREAPGLLRRGHTLRVWSAASSSGEEAYSIAMVLAESCGLEGWEVLGSDISTQVLHRAVQGVYPMARAGEIPAASLQRWCRRGTGDAQGQFLIERALRERVHFGQVNLDAPLPKVGLFQFIFLRNVMIYFNDRTKAEVVGRLLHQLEPGGCLIVGRSETLHGLATGLATVGASIYRKPALGVPA